MRDVKNYLMRKGVLDEEGKCACCESGAGIARKGSAQSLVSDAGGSEVAETPPARETGLLGEQSSGSTTKLLRGAKLSGKSLRFNELVVHRNFSTWGAVPPQLLRLLFGELCPGQLHFYALKASYSNAHQKEISRSVADQLFEFLTGQRKELRLGEERDLPSLLKLMQGWHEERGFPGHRIDGRCDFKQHGVYSVQPEEGESSKTHVLLVDHIRMRKRRLCLAELDNVSAESLYIQTNYSDRHATLESVARTSLSRNCWDMLTGTVGQAMEVASPCPAAVRTPAVKRKRTQEPACMIDACSSCCIQVGFVSEVFPFVGWSCDGCFEEEIDELAVIEKEKLEKDGDDLDLPSPED
eukprot:2693156-Amphidinium_carterae.2